VLEEGGVKFIALRCAGFDKVGAAPPAGAAAAAAAQSCCQLLLLLLLLVTTVPCWPSGRCNFVAPLCISQRAWATRRVDQQKSHPAPLSLRRWMWRRAPATASASCASLPTGARPPSRPCLLACGAPVSHEPVAIPVWWQREKERASALSCHCIAQAACSQLPNCALNCTTCLALPPPPLQPPLRG
jgi:hypothetical protein